jgi:hypothetical protein
MVNMALEGYELQPKKSVAIHIRGNNKQCETTNEKLNMGNITMPGKSSSCSRGFEDGNNSSIP